MGKLRTLSFYFAWVVALVGTLVAFYHGEVLRLEPCQLCWYQRIIWFPLTILLGIGVYRADTQIIPYCLVLVVIGLSLAIYQVMGEYFPGIHINSLCGFGADCSVPVLVLNLVSIPVLSIAGFVLVAIFLLFTWLKKE